MNKLQKGLLVSALGGTIIVSAITMERTSTYIENLKEKIKDKDLKISETLKENKELTTKNRGLLDENEELNNRIKDISFKSVSFNPNNITQGSNVGSKQLEIVFKANSRYSALKGLGQSFVDAERQYGVNAIFLLGLVSQESDYGKSSRAVRDNNLTGFAIYNKASVKSFGTKSENILSTAKLLRDRYIKNGLTTIKDIGRVYCPEVEWAEPIIHIGNKFENEINNI